MSWEATIEGWHEAGYLILAVAPNPAIKIRLRISKGVALVPYLLHNENRHLTIFKLKKRQVLCANYTFYQSQGNWQSQRGERNKLRKWGGGEGKAWVYKAAAEVGGGDERGRAWRKEIKKKQATKKWRWKWRVEWRMKIRNDKRKDGGRRWRTTITISGNSK